jgi:hypothetical protein
LQELQSIHSLITHKEHELAVYRNARELIKCQAPKDKCLVFLADNMFVMRTREQALDILQRQIQGLLYYPHKKNIEKN